MTAHTIQSVARAALILDAVAASREGVTLRELADRLVLNASTLHHLAQTLVQRGMLVQSPEAKRYRIGPAVMEWAAAAHRDEDFQAVEVAVRRTADALPDATVVFCRLLAGEVVATMRISPQRPGVVERPHHQVMSPYTSSSAIALQAFAPDEDRATYQQRHPFDDYGAQHWSTRDRLDAFLADARTRGVVIGPPVQAFNRAAVPVINARHECVGVLGASIAGEAHHHDLADHIANTLLDAIDSSGFIRFNQQQGSAK